MRHISYAETRFSTDDRVAALLLDYAALLARAGSADTVTVPGRVSTGNVEPVSVLIGPASQITAWGDDEPFGEEVSGVIADLEQRIRAVTSSIASSDGPDGPGFDDFDDLA